MDKKLFGDLVESMQQHDEIIAVNWKAAKRLHKDKILNIQYTTCELVAGA